MRAVRPLRESDLEQVINLHEKVWPTSAASGSRLEEYLRRILFESPFANPDFPSLGFDDDGKIVGIIGSVWRPMLFRDEPMDMVVTHTFIADPERRSALVGVQLLQEILGGRQHLSVAQGNETSAKLWRAVGGDWSPLLGLHWTRLLRPFSYVESRLKSRGQTVLRHLMRPARLLLDPVVTKAGRSPVSHGPPGGVTAQETGPEGLVDLLTQGQDDRAIIPRYDVKTLSWMLDALRYRRSRGDVRVLLLRIGSDKPFGWLCYCASPGRVFQVVSIGAARDKIGHALEYLFWDAYERGADAIEGLVDPAFVREYADRHCYFTTDDSWFLIHSRDPELRAAMHRGDCFVSRMEAEWWLGFQEETSRV